jgi:hypothetical protein
MANLQSSTLNNDGTGEAFHVQQAAQIRVKDLLDHPVCTENSNPDVMMVKPAEDRV